MALTPTDGTGGTQGVDPTGSAGRTSLDVSGLKLPSKAQVSEKLSTFGSGAGHALKGMGKGLKLGGAHTLIVLSSPIEPFRTSSQATRNCLLLRCCVPN